MGILLVFGSDFYELRAEDKKFSVTGYIRDAATNENLPQAAVWIANINTGTVSNLDGKYSILLSKGTYYIEVRFLGYTTEKDTINVSRNLNISFSLSPEATQLKDVIIHGKDNSSLNQNSLGMEHLSMESIKKLPSFMGEPDLLKSVQLLPGIIMTSEGSSGFSVRGGSPDQNYILLDRAPIYNPSHALGFFSIFNNDVMEGATVYKGDIPVQFGGRLSSVIDATMRDGDFNKYHITGGVGLLLTRLTVDGPIYKDLCSFLVAGRRTYFDLFLPLFNMKDIKLYFYDLNAKFSFRTPSRKDKITLSGYMGRDVFGMKSMHADMDYGNKALDLTWSHFFNPNFVMNASAIVSDYRYLLGMESDMYALKWASHLTDYGGKLDFIYHLGTGKTNSHDIRFGISSTYHIYNPGDINVSILEGMSFLDTVVDWSFNQERFHTLENGFYVGNDQKIGKHILLKYGFRISTFSNIGADSVFIYDDNFNVSDVKHYPKGNFYHTQWGIEPRVGITYMIDSTMSLKLNYTRTMQYSQMAQNSTSGNPLDVWFPANPTMKPQTADQVALGFEKNFRENEWQTSIEFYFRYLQNVIDFKDHSQVMGNSYLYGEIRSGTGMAYGMEIMVKRTRGIVNGSISYTLSKSTRQIDEVNKGKLYPSPYDRPHSVSVLLNIEPHPRHSLSFNWVFYSGLPTTYPRGKAIVDGEWVPIYGERNSDRMPDYHRLDIAYTLHSKYVPGRRFSWDLSVGCYNAYARKNPWSISFKQDPENPGHSYSEMIYLFSAVPSITFNFKW